MEGRRKKERNEKDPGNEAVDLTLHIYLPIDSKTRCLVPWLAGWEFTALEEFLGWRTATEQGR